MKYTHVKLNTNFNRMPSAYFKRRAKFLPSGQMAARTRWIFGTTWRGISPWSFPSLACPGPLTSRTSGRERKISSSKKQIKTAPLRACLKNVSTPKRRSFFRHTAPIFLEIHPVFPQKIVFVWRKNSPLLCIFPFFKQRLVGPLARICGRQAVSPRLETRSISRPYRADTDHPLYGWF